MSRSGASVRLAVTLLAIGTLPGCADNAILEVVLALPAQGVECGVSEVLVEARFSPIGELACPAVDWNRDAQTIPLEEEEASSAFVEVIAEGDDIERPLCLRVRSCRQEACLGHDLLVHPSVTVRAERAFYRGHRTRVELAIADPCESDAYDLGPCEIGGCDEGGAACDADGRHFCE